MRSSLLDSTRKLYWMLLLVCIAVCWSGCNKSGNNTNTSEISKVKKSADTIDVDTSTRNRFSYGDTVKVSEWLREDLLKDDLPFLKPEQRYYNLDAFDLNQDGKIEYFIGFANDYFCGSGGCTYFIVNHKGELVSLLTGSKAPFYILSSTTNGWNDLLINADGYRKLTYSESSYQNNPSALAVFTDSTETSQAVTVLASTERFVF